MFSNREGTPGFALAGALIGDSEGPRPRSAATIRSGQDIYRKHCGQRASPIEDEVVALARSPQSRQSLLVVASTEMNKTTYDDHCSQDLWMRRMAAGFFKVHCLAVIDEVQAKRESVLITKHGKPMAKLVPADKNIDDIYDFLGGKGPLQATSFPPPISQEGWGKLK